MIFIEPFKNFSGFGNGNYATGEYVHSQGMNKSLNGIIPGWNAASSIDDSSLSGLDLVKWFTQAVPASSTYIFSADINGRIYNSLNGINAWALSYIPGQTTGGNGLIGIPTGPLLYLQTRYLGKYDGTANYTDGTIAVTNGSANVVGTGTTFTSSMANKRILVNGVWYTIATFTDATHIALSSNYAGSTASGLSYAIYVGWNDLFQDFGSGSLPSDSDYRDADTYEDTVIMCNGHYLSTYNVVTNSFNAQAFTLPSKDFARAVRSGRNGVLAGINRGNRGAFFLWDNNSDRSISPWIWKNGNIQAIVAYDGDWLVITNREIILTNGYTSEVIVPAPDNLINQTLFSVAPQGAQVINNYLVIANNAVGINRMKGGFWILNLKTRLWEYAPVANGATYNNSMGAVFFDSNVKTHISWATSIPNRKSIGSFTSSNPTSAYIITQPLGQGNRQKIAEAAKLNLGVSPYQTASQPITFNVSVKVYDFKRPLWSYAQQKVLATLHNKITVDGTVSGSNNAEVGDEVTVMEGTNAGQVAHITVITDRNTATEVWTLDTDFTGFTEQNVLIQVMPFKLLKKYSISSLTELKELYFNCKNKIKGQKFLLKILLDNIGSVSIELLEGDFIYDDLGTFTTN